MCEATVVIVTQDDEQVLMRDVSRICLEGDLVVMNSLLGEQKLVRGAIQEMDFLKHVVRVKAALEPAVS